VSPWLDALTFDNARALFSWAVRDPATAGCVLFIGLHGVRVMRKGLAAQTAALEKKIAELFAAQTEQLKVQIDHSMRGAVGKIAGELTRPRL
jgi:hypothetical protein